MRARDLAWGALLVAGCSFHAECGGKKKIDARQIEKTLQSQPTAGVTFTKVTCPDDVEVKVGATFDCQIEVDGRKTYPIHVNVTSVEGTKFQYTNAWPRPVISEKTLRDLLAPASEELGVPVTVDCGEPLREFSDERTVSCDSTVGSLKTKVIVFFDDKLQATKREFADSFYTTPKIASLVTPAVQQQLGADTVVDCGPPDARKAPADGVVSCNVTRGADKGILRIEMNENLDLGAWRVEPVE